MCTALGQVRTASGQVLAPPRRAILLTTAAAAAALVRQQQSQQQIQRGAAFKGWSVAFMRTLQSAVLIGLTLACEAER